MAEVFWSSSSQRNSSSVSSIPYIYNAIPNKIWNKTVSPSRVSVLLFGTKEENQVKLVKILENLVKNYALYCPKDYFNKWKSFISQPFWGYEGLRSPTYIPFLTQSPVWIFIVTPTKLLLRCLFSQRKSRAFLAYSYN